jgi:hypothetical protein
MRSDKPTFLETILAALLLTILVLVMYGAATAHANGAEPDPLMAARQRAQANHKPLIVLAGATWCAPCNAVAVQYESKLKTRGVYLHVQLNREPWFAERLPTVYAYPTLFIWEPDGKGGWHTPIVRKGVPEIRVYVEGR